MVNKHSSIFKIRSLAQSPEYGDHKFAVVTATYLRCSGPFLIS